MVASNYLWNPLSDNVVREFDDSGSAVAEYTTEPRRFGNLISQHRSGASSYFHFDGVGSTVAVTSSAGAIVDSRAYTAFGTTMEQAGSTVFPWQYIGQKGYFRDATIEQYTIRRRWYSPNAGRWNTCDPLGPNVDVNVYRYALNAPLTNNDPSGLLLDCAACVVCAGAGAGSILACLGFCADGCWNVPGEGIRACMNKCLAAVYSGAIPFAVLACVGLCILCPIPPPGGT